MRLSPCQWPKVSLRAAKCLIKNGLSKVYVFFSVFIVVFNRQGNISCSIGSISRPIFSRDHNATNQAIAMDTYQSYYRKLDNFFSEKQQGAVRTDQKIYSLLVYDFCMVLRIFKLATSLSIFSLTRLLLTQQRKQMKSNYKF